MEGCIQGLGGVDEKSSEKERVKEPLRKVQLPALGSSPLQIELRVLTCSSDPLVEDAFRYLASVFRRVAERKLG